MSDITDIHQSKTPCYKRSETELIVGLRKCIYIREAYTKVIKALVEEKKDFVDLTKDRVSYKSSVE